MVAKMQMKVICDYFMGVGATSDSDRDQTGFAHFQNKYLNLGSFSSICDNLVGDDKAICVEDDNAIMDSDDTDG